MKILHLTHTDPKTDNRILKELIALSRNDIYKITCLGIHLNEGSSSTNLETKAEIIVITLYSKIEMIPRPIRHMLMFFELFIRFVSLSISIKPNVIHCHDTLVLPIGVFLSKLFKAKLIYDAHELESDKNGQTKFLSKATLLIEKISWSSIDHFISVSESIILWYKKKLGVKKSSLILNSPMIEENNYDNSNYFHKLYDIPNESLVFVYLGILDKGRGIDFIIDAFSESAIKSHVVFIGYGAYDKKIKRASLTAKNIHLHAAVPHEDVVSLVKNADVGLCLIENVSLSDFYCLPNKLFEYTFAGLPVLASNFPDIKNIVIKYNLGRVCDINSKSINEAVSEIEVTHLSNINSDLTELGWPNQAEKLRKTYYKLTNKF